METMRPAAAARLNAALNRPSNAPLPWPKSVKETPAAFSTEQVLAWLAESNPELKGMAAEIAQAEKEIELARKAYWPDPTVGLGFTARGPDMEGGMDTKVFTLGFNLPIWRGKLAAGVRGAQSRHLAAMRQREDTANTMAAEVQMTVWQFQDAARKIGLYRDTLLPKAREALTTTQKAFEAGKASFTDFIDAQRTLLEFQLSYERALANREQRLGELEALVGRKITSDK
jgi:outer membrane protein TolC